MRRLALLTVLLATGCGTATHPAATTTTSTTSKNAAVRPRPKLGPAGLAAARKLLRYDAEDAAAAQLGGRKAASPALHAFALRILRDRNAELDALHRYLRATPATSLPGVLVDNAGIYFDSAYASFMRDRIAAERALGGPLRALVARNRAAESRALARL